MLDFSIVIPIYNENENIEKMVDEIQTVLSSKYKYELLFVNDCSEDESSITLKRLKNINNFVVVNNKSNLGQSHSILNGIKYSNTNVIVTMDGDLQNNPDDIIKLFNVYKSNENLKLVSGIRKNRKDNTFKKISSIIANSIRSFILKDKCTDTGCGLKVFDKEIFLTFPFFEGIHRFLPALFNGYGFEVSFINVDHRHRIFGKSKYGTFDRLFKGIFDIIRIRKIIRNNKKK